MSALKSSTACELLTIGPGLWPAHELDRVGGWERVGARCREPALPTPPDSVRVLYTLRFHYRANNAFMRLVVFRTINDPTGAGAGL